MSKINQIMKRLKTLFFTALFLSSSISGFTQSNYSVYIFVAEKCPISIYMAKPLQEAYEKFGNQVDFYAVFPMKNSSEKSASKFLNEYGLSDFDIKLDNYQGCGEAVPKPWADAVGCFITFH